MSWGQFFILWMLSISIGIIAGDIQEIRQLKQRVAALEKRTRPLVRMCEGTEDDFYEALSRLILEECEQPKPPVIRSDP